MAKRKKSKKRSQAQSVPAPSSGAMLNITNIVLVIISTLTLVGWFNTGGALPIGLYDTFHWLFGMAAAFVAFNIIYLVIYRFARKGEGSSLKNVLSACGLWVVMAGFFYIFTLKTGETSEPANSDGGFIGQVSGGFVYGMFDKFPALVILFAIGFLLFFWTFNLSIKRFGGILKRIFSRPESKDQDLETLKANNGFKLNQGVPLEETNGAPPDKKPVRLSSLKNTAKQLSGAEDHQALVAAKDPDWVFPKTNLLNTKQDKADAGDINQNADIIRSTLGNFNVDVDMEGANVGPRVTQYTLKPPTGVKLTKITSLEDNLALDLAATSIRIEAPIPGKRLVGIEVPNYKAATVRLGSIFNNQVWHKAESPLSFVIGQDISGVPIVADLAKMPHLLVAGQTGSGKSVMINDFLTSLLYKNSPSDLKLILVDPKQVEMAPYDNIPHLLTPVITEPEKCISALKWAVAEMDRRLKTMAKEGKRNIQEYNNVNPDEAMPYIVIVIDELADLMMMAARDVEALIVRIAQKARAAGIHLVLATQRPSVDVITGLIKANVPARIAFTVASQIDSRTIIDQVGANKLLGQGDLLFKTTSMPAPQRVQAAFISDEETMKVTDFIRSQREPQYDDEVISQVVQLNGKGGIVTQPDGLGGGGADDDMWEDAVRVVIEGRKASTSLLQRRLRIGYARAARIIEMMEEQGIIGQADGSRPREVLVNSMDDVFGEAEPVNAGFVDTEDPRDEYLAR